MGKVTLGGISRLLLASVTSYKRICFDEEEATQPDVDIDVATSSVMGIRRCPGLCRRVSDSELNAAENDLKCSIKDDGRRSADRPRLLVMDIFNVLRRRMSLLLRGKGGACRA